MEIRENDIDWLNAQVKAIWKRKLPEESVGTTVAKHISELIPKHWMDYTPEENKLLNKVYLILSTMCTMDQLYASLQVYSKRID